MTGTSFWRVAGLSYVKYVEISSQAIRKCIKTKDSKVLQRGEVHFQERIWKSGSPGEKSKFFE